MGQRGREGEGEIAEVGMRNAAFDELRRGKVGTSKSEMRLRQSAAGLRKVGRDMRTLATIDAFGFPGAVLVVFR